MIKSKHSLSYCDHCECEMVICAYCGNNCCNAGTGQINGEECGCEEAYNHQHKYYEDSSSVEFSTKEQHVKG